MNIIVLEHPRIRSEKKFNDIANTPLWSCLMGGYAAAGLRQAGHDVCFMDTTKTRWNFKKTKQEVLALRPDMLCVNAVYFWEHTMALFAFFNELRAQGFKGHISLFGFFPTLAYEVILKNIDAVDSVVVGECEETLKELAAGLAQKETLTGITGLATRSVKGATGVRPRRPAASPDRFAFPERSPVQEETASLLGSRGCYNHCSFCLVPSFYNHGPLWRGRTPENIFDEIVRLIDVGYRDFYFVDPNFIGPGKKGKERIKALLDLIRPLDITFGMETRPNDLDPDLLDQLVSAGFKSLLLGIESGSSSVLANLNKGGLLNSSEQAIEFCRDTGIEPEVGFLMFVPDSTLEDLKYNFEFLQQNNLLDRLGRTANLLGHRQIVLMGTSGYRLYEKQGRLKRTGVLGFEGEVSYLDGRVKWISDLMIHACLYVLRDMEQATSPIYWRRSRVDNKDQPEAEIVNEYLTTLFTRLIDVADNSKTLPAAREMKSDIEKELLREIGA